VDDDGVESSRRYCALVIGSEGMAERGLGHGEPRHACPRPLPFICARSATGAHNHELVSAPDQGAR
jgi:hypothetical protein